MPGSSYSEKVDLFREPGSPVYKTLANSGTEIHDENGGSGIDKTGIRASAPYSPPTSFYTNS